MTTVDLSAGRARVVIDATGGGHIDRLTVDTLDLLVPPESNDHNYGAFPMAPFAGRVRAGRFEFDGVQHQLPLNKPPNAIHGTVRDQRWTVDHADATSATISVVLGDPWPFAGRVVQHFALASDSLSLTMEVHAEQPMPASCGWHPWWSRNLGPADAPGLEVELHADEMYACDDAGIPTGALVPVVSPPWDDCFTALGRPAAVVQWPGVARVAIETDCPCVVVFTEPEHAVCVEPQSGPPDELNLAPHIVTPDAPLVVHTTWHWSVGRTVTLA